MSVTPIATRTLTTSTASITFSGIPGSWQDLMLVATSNGTAISTFISWQVNGDTTSKYINAYIFGGPYTATPMYTSYGALRGNGALSITQLPTGIGLSNNVIAHFFNYADTSKWKSMLCESNDARQYYGISSGTWQSTSAITSLKIFPDTGVFNTGTSVTLYGVSA
jgi:hypothetical protein